MMRTFAQNMMPFMTGRTFSNPVERGDYPSEAYAVHTAQDLVDAFVRYIVDHYHQREHQGLNYNSPAQSRELGNACADFVGLTRRHCSSSTWGSAGPDITPEAESKRR